MWSNLMEQGQEIREARSAGFHVRERRQCKSPEGHLCFQHFLTLDGDAKIGGSSNTKSALKPNGNCPQGPKGAPGA